MSQETNIQDLKDAVEELQQVVVKQQGKLIQLSATPIVLAPVVSCNHQIIPSRFTPGDDVLVIDKRHECFERIGKIVSEEVDLEKGTIVAEFPGFLNLKNRKHTLKIGLNGHKSQVKLLLKNDGTNVRVALDKITEVWNSERFDPKPGDTAKINSETQQVVEIIPNDGIGELCAVKAKIDENVIEVESGQHGSKYVLCYQTVEVGDKVVVDKTGTIVLRHISEQKNQRFRVKEELKVSWEDVGGVLDAKQQLIEAIELPILRPEVFAFYNQKPPSGILLYGPPGCGKTLLGKAAATAIARLHGKESVVSGFNYVKGPEMLSPWVGESEAEVRGLFQRGRRHYEQYGYPCVTFVDEADAILQARGGDNGGRRTERWHDSMVAMWLAEMDGLESAHQIVILATNRPKSLDGAIVREGRIDKHIKVTRPTKETAPAIFKIHLDNTPLHQVSRDEVAALATEELLKERPLYILSHQGNGGTQKEVFGLADCVSGSLIAGIVREAKSQAMRRDLTSGKKPIGVTVEDVHQAIGLAYARHADISHDFDLLDFYDAKGFDPNKVRLEKVREVV